MQTILTEKFFNRPTLTVARGLLGKYLVRRSAGWRRRREIALPITEVEAYVGFSDRASHAARGQTPRNRVMFGPPGFWYVYFTYGMHWMLNVVTGREGYPAAVLIRGVKGISGPARLTKHFGIDKRFNNKTASRRTGLWLEDRGIIIPPRQIKRSPRIGIDHAGPWKKKLWRFYLLN